MIDEKAKIVLCCATPKKFNETILNKSINISDDEFTFDEIDVVQENQLGLSKVYNGFINKYKTIKNTVLVFVHDDVSLDDSHLRQKVVAGLKSFSIIGLAGTKKFKLESPCLWHHSPKEAWSGAVAHHSGNRTFMTAYGDMPAQCLIIDGLFIAIDLDEIIKADLKFDEQFAFHHYDMDFCLQAYKKRIKVGTWPIWVTHYSVGLWDKPEWHKSNELMMKKWKNAN